MIMVHRSPEFRRKLEASYKQNRMKYTIRNSDGSGNRVQTYVGHPATDRVSFVLSDILTHHVKPGHKQTHTCYHDVIDLFDVLKEVFACDGIDAFPVSNYYVHTPTATPGSH